MTDNYLAGPHTLQPWTEEELGQLWLLLKLGAQQILGEVASRLEGYPLDELKLALGIEGRQLAGRLSSVRHAMNYFFPNKVAPIERRRQYYWMAPEVAAVIRRLAGLVDDR